MFLLIHSLFQRSNISARNITFRGNHMIENTETRLEEVDESEISEKKETTHFPWTIAIIVGVLTLLIIACFIVIWVIEH